MDKRQARALAIARDKALKEVRHRLAAAKEGAVDQQNASINKKTSNVMVKSEDIQQLKHLKLVVPVSSLFSPFPFVRPQLSPRSVRDSGLLLLIY